PSTTADGAPAPPVDVPAAAPAAEAAPPRLGRRRAAIYLSIGVVALLASLVALLWYLQESRLYVFTDNAYVHGWTIHVGSTVAGRVRTMRYDVGDRVERDSVVATLGLGTVRGVPLSWKSQLEYTGADLLDVPLPSLGGI